jgi:SAM-dependent methyltransferase
MSARIWENFISLYGDKILHNDVLSAAHEYVAQDDGSVQWNKKAIPVDSALKRDRAPLPLEQDREMYYGPNHYNYWASGIRDYMQLKEYLDRKKIKADALLDIGCASGRFVRAAHFQGQMNRVIGCDINRLHVDWVARNLPRDIEIFQNTSIPYLPLQDESLDVVTAFSVFTHIETFDTAWLMEIKRVLRPGGIAWITVHSDRTWRELIPDWPLYNALNTHPEYMKVRTLANMPYERTVFRWISEASYSANVFYSEEYLRRIWDRIIPMKDIFPALPHFQDVVVLQKEIVKKSTGKRTAK